MGQYVVKRILFSLLVLLAISVIVFSAVRVIPGNVCHIVLQTPDVTKEQCTVIDKELGIDQPMVTQYFKYMGGVLTGDFGKSLITKRAVGAEMKDRIPLTIELTLLSTFFALVIAIPIGVVSAVRQDSLSDYGLRFLTIGWLSIPSFWLGTMLIVFPSKWWHYGPPVGYVNIWEDPLRNLEQLYLPAISLGLALSASLARVTRSSMLEVLRQDYIRTARAKGLGGAVVVVRHALRNAMIPVTTLFALQVGVLFGGTVVLESIFSLPGLGGLTLSAVRAKDYSQVQGLVLLFATVLVVLNLLVDLSYAWIDPRIRYS
ncbi:MAG: glutathione ABC transporter permease GsiC [Anaerolinea sp.]|nr:glutathione ABC transporter permease GsiC [Anaerolinea sp.]